MVWGGLLCEVICDALDVEVNKGLLASIRTELPGCCMEEDVDGVSVYLFSDADYNKYL